MSSVGGESFTILKVEQDIRRPTMYIVEWIGHQGQGSLTVHEDLIVRYRLVKGKQLDEGTIQAIEEGMAFVDAERRAYLLLGRKPHSEKELRRKLKQKGFQEAAIDQAVERLKQRRYLHDGDFATWSAEQRILSQKKGSRYVKQELAEKGVAHELIQQALSKIDPEAEYQQALALARKRWKTGDHQDLRAQTQKLTAYLLRRGYPNDIVRNVMQNLQIQTDEDWGC